MKYLGALVVCSVAVSGCGFFSLPRDVLYECPTGECDQPGFECRLDGLCHPATDPPTLIDGGSLPDSGTDSGTSDAGSDSGVDAGADAGTDAGTDAGEDAGNDGGLDGGLDAGPPAMCGPLTDGGRLECPPLETCGGGGDDGGLGRAGICAKDTRFCTEDNWCWEHPTPQGNTLRAIAVAGPDDVWMVGDHGTILRRENGLLYRVRSPARVNLLGVWADGPGDVWIVGEGGLRLHFANNQWDPRPSDSIIENLWGVARDTSGVLWVAGEQCVLASLSAGQWVTSSSPISCAPNCNVRQLRPALDGGMLGVGGGPAGYFRCVVTKGATTWSLLRYEQSHAEFKSVIEHQGKVLCGSEDGVYEALPDGGFVESSPSSLTALSVDFTGRAWGAGLLADGGDVQFLNDAGVWEPIPLQGRRNRTLALAFTPDGGEGVGLFGTMLRIGADGGVSRWPGQYDTFNFTDVWAADFNAVHAVGGGSIHGQRAGDGLWTVNYEVSYYPRDVWSPGGNDFVVVTDYNGFFRRSSLNASVPDFGMNQVLTAAWGFAADDLLLAGDGRAAGVSRLFRGPGQPLDMWTTYVLPIDAGISEISGLADSGIAWLVGGTQSDSGVVLTFQSDGGIALDPLTHPVALNGVSALAVDDVWAVGPGGYVTRLTSGWSRIPSGTDAGLNSVWAGRTRTVAVGQRGTVLVWQDGGPTMEWTGTRLNLNGVSGLDGIGVWAVGDDQSILRRKP